LILTLNIILAYPTDNVVLLGHRTVIKCKSNKPVYWLFKGKRIQNSRLQIKDSRILVLENLQLKDAGIYTCKTLNERWLNHLLHHVTLKVLGKLRTSS